VTSSWFFLSTRNSSAPYNIIAHVHLYAYGSIMSLKQYVQITRYISKWFRFHVIIL